MATDTKASSELGGREYVGVTDPVYVPPANPNAFQRFALSLIRDPRDLPFVELSVQCMLFVVPAGVFLFWPGHVTADGWSWAKWAVAIVYLPVLFLGFVDRFILMLHNTSHRELYKKEHAWMNHIIPWVIGPFMGETPETYYSHHLGMHHPENNLENDLSSTMRYKRDGAFDFVRYFSKFFFLTIFELPPYLRKHNRNRLAFKAVFGEVCFYAVAIGAAFFNWRASLIMFVIPYLTVRFLMMCGNWGQHAFIDARDPSNCYLNSITCINVRYNHRSFNDGYHIGHHLRQMRHYSDLPVEFRDNVAKYAKEGAIVFEGIDFFMVWFFLMFGRYDILARHYVRLDGQPKSESEIIALLRSRTQPIGVFDSAVAAPAE